MLSEQAELRNLTTIYFTSSLMSEMQVENLTTVELSWSSGLTRSELGGTVGLLLVRVGPHWLGMNG